MHVQAGTLHPDQHIVIASFKPPEIVIPVRLTGSSTEATGAKTQAFHPPDVWLFVTTVFFAQILTKPPNKQNINSRQLMWDSTFSSLQKPSKVSSQSESYAPKIYLTFLQ